MTKLRDKWEYKNSCWFAKSLNEILWYFNYRGKPNPTYTYYIPWAWPAHTLAGTGLRNVRRLCEITDGLRCETRPAVESDFFVVCPEDIDGDVLVITNEACYPPDDLDQLFGNVRISKKYSETGYMKFTW